MPPVIRYTGEVDNNRLGAGWLLAAQLLLGVLIYLVVSIYPRSRSIALALSLFIVLGMVYCGWRGIKLIWEK